MSVRMSDPPRSTVADPIDDRAARRKPAVIEYAVLMLWASLAAGAVNVLFQPDLERPEGWLGWIAPAAAVAFVILLTVSISAGLNWARITFLGFLLIGTLPYLLVLQDVFTRSMLFGALGVFQALLQFGAMALVFTSPGAAWFRKEERLPT